MSFADSDYTIDSSEIDIKPERSEFINIHIKTENIDRTSTDNSDIVENKDLYKDFSNVKTESSSIKYNCELAEKINVNDYVQNITLTIKQEFENTDFEVNKELLHSVCNLLPLKSEDIGIADGHLKQKKKKQKLGNKYQCSFCRISFSSIDQRFKHQCKKFSEICSYCGEYFYQRIQFLMHFFRHHFIKNTKNSDKQRSNLYRKKYAKHLQYAICAKKFQIQNHLKRLQLDNRKNMFKCKICLKVFKLNNGLGKTESVRCKTCSKSLDKTSLGGKNTLKCKVCFKVFLTKISLKLHMGTHTLKDNLIKRIEEKPFKCDICSRGFKLKKYITKHMLVHNEEKPHQCEICSQTFRHKPSLKLHMLKHTGESPFKCEICSHTFRIKSHLKQHMVTHTEEKPFQCEICSRSFGYKSNLKQHMLIHTGEKPFQCELCSYTIRHKRSFKQHMLTHTGEKPYKCEICLYAFKDKYDLKKHKRIHTGERPFVCDICFQNNRTQTYSFRTKNALNQHMVIHTGVKPFKCELCSYTCGLKPNLKRHMLIHTEEKAFKCEICSNSFAYKASLKQHMLVHTGEKPFKCIICLQTFRHKKSLTRHMMTHSEKAI